ncbi:MAG: hypothetical protein JWP07_3985 [Pseudonocardiales bacterium]|nr:hypothetical protein [Pseudonocardiales bacterium]
MQTSLLIGNGKQSVLVATASYRVVRANWATRLVDGLRARLRPGRHCLGVNPSLPWRIQG